MKSIVIRMMLALAVLTVVPNALADANSGNFFLDAKFGTAFGKPAGTGYSSQTHVSWGADGGYLWKLDDQRALGLEAGYMHFGDVADSGGNFGTSKISATAIPVGVRFEYLFGEDKATLFQVHGGLLRMKFNEDVNAFFGSSGSDSWTETGTYIGVGIGRKLTQSFSLMLVYNNYNADSGGGGNQLNLDLHWIGLEADYRF